jgi:hypothetical protein
LFRSSSPLILTDIPIKTPCFYKRSWWRNVLDMK